VEKPEQAPNRRKETANVNVCSTKRGDWKKNLRGISRGEKEALKWEGEIIGYKMYENILESDGPGEDV